MKKDFDSPAGKPVPIILDTDIGPDCDDAGALAVLHALADRGEAEILGVIHCTSNSWGAPCIDAINTYYGRPHIPVGTLKREGFLDGEPYSKYNRWIGQHFPNQYLDGQMEVPDAVDVYREILAGQPDGSVVIVAIGPLPNLHNLLMSPPDSHSPLNGCDLVEKKVRQLVVMGGCFPRAGAKGPSIGSEWNFEMDPAAAQYVMANWPGSIMLSDFYIGWPVMTGARLLSETPEDNPVRMAYQLYTEDGNRMSWDLTAVLYGVRGLGEYWNAVTGGYVEVDDKGRSHWQDSPDGKHGYLTEKMDTDRLAQVLEDLMVKPPSNKA